MIVKVDNQRIWLLISFSITINYREMSSVQVVVLLNLILRLTEQLTYLATQLVKREYCKSPITRLLVVVKILPV